MTGAHSRDLPLLLPHQLEGVGGHVRPAEEGGRAVHARLEAVVLVEATGGQGAAQRLGEAGQVVVPESSA